MAEAGASKLLLKLLVDKERNRVIFAEADKDFVDVLFSFLTLPMGSIIRLLGMKSGIGSMDRLYQSVANLDRSCFKTPACQSMLLHPRSDAEICCKGLAIDVDSDSEPWTYYRCLSSCKSSLSPVAGARCSCGRTAEAPFLAPGTFGDAGSKKGFVAEGVNFIVTDDLFVQPASIGISLALINELGVEDGNVLEKKIVHLGREEILSLLKISFISKAALTHVFLQEMGTIDNLEKLLMDDIIQSRAKRKIKNESTPKIHMKLFLNNDGDEVVYAESNEELVDLMFSFLAFPLGSIIKLLDKSSSLGCIDNLYKGAELLSYPPNQIISDEWKEMLLAPKLAPFFGIDKQLVQIEEASPRKIQLCPCISSSKKNRCYHGNYGSCYDQINPKSLDSGLELGGGYMKPMGRYMITDGMEVTLLSPIDSVHMINKLMVPISSLEEVAAFLGEAEALDLLRACLISNKVFSGIFSPYLIKLLQVNWVGRSSCKSDT